ncbi:hypothetical protein ACHQM5_030854 [Ranunculus cassubicifolius]
MKVIVSILFIIAVQLAESFTSPVSNSASKCGSLGVMQTNNLPKGINSVDVRTCADHPLGHHRSGVQSLAPMRKADLSVAATNANRVGSGMVQPDKCYYKAPYGCSDGYCWKACGPGGSGQWCWLAANNGVGNWIKCSTYEQCSLGGAGCGKNCRPGSHSCGCSC